MGNDVDPRQAQAASEPVGGEITASGKEQEESGVLDLLRVLSSRKVFLLLSAFGCGTAAAILSFLVSPTYRATAIVMPPQQQTSAASAIMGQLGTMAGLAGSTLGLKNPLDPYMGILNSRTVADKLIAEFSLRQVYKAKTMTAARRKLARRTSFNSARFSMIQVSVEDSDPKRAADLANAYIDQLQQQNSRLAVTEASQRRLFYERQLDSERRQLADAEMELKKIQEQKGIYQVASQVELIIATIARMRAEIVVREVALQRLATSATPQNPEVLRQEAELKALRRQLRELEASSADKRSGDPFMPTTAVPAAALEYAQRLRDLKYHEAMFEALAKQYEIARIDEAKESPIIQVVDRAVSPDERSAPRRSLYVVTGIILGGLFAILWALFSQAARNPLPAGKVRR